MGEITAAKEGAVVDIGPAGDPVKVIVGPKCDTNSGSWYCVTHTKGFDNQLQKDFHIHDGDHVLAWMCVEHGPETP